MVTALLLEFSSLHPSFFPSIMLFLTMLIVILLISSQGIQAVKQMKGRTLQQEREWKDW